MDMKKSLNVEIGNRIRISRECAGLTQEELAEEINRSTQFISTIERGVAGASLETIISICDVLSVSSDWLLRGLKPSPSADSIAAKFAFLSDAQLLVINKLADDVIALVKISEKTTEYPNS